MSKVTIIRRVDELGRIVIPIEFRKMMNMESGQDVEMTIQENALLLRRFSPGCVFCGGYDNIRIYEGKNVCADCRRKLAEET